MPSPASKTLAGVGDMTERRPPYGETMSYVKCPTCNIRCITWMTGDNRVHYHPSCQECEEVMQVLGKVLGYPPFPGATETDGICTGPHTAGTIANEAARRIKQLEAELSQCKIDYEAVCVEYWDGTENE